MEAQRPVTLPSPTVVHRWDGVLADVEHFDDRVMLHRPERHKTHSRGRTSTCTNARCNEPAVIDKRVWSGQLPTWRAVCAPHGRSYADLLGPTMRALVLEMINGVEKEQK